MGRGNPGMSDFGKKGKRKNRKQMRGDSPMGLGSNMNLSGLASGAPQGDPMGAIRSMASGPPDAGSWAGDSHQRLVGQARANAYGDPMSSVRSMARGAPKGNPLSALRSPGFASRRDDLRSRLGAAQGAQRQALANHPRNQGPSLGATSRRAQRERQLGAMARRSPIWRRNEGGLVARGGGLGAPRPALGSASRGSRGDSLQSMVAAARGGALNQGPGPMAIGGRSSISDMANAFTSRRPVPEADLSESVVEYSMPTPEQDAFYKAQYETQGYVPRGGWESLYTDPSSLSEVYVGDRFHLAPSSWNPQDLSRVHRIGPDPDYDEVAERLGYEFNPRRGGFGDRHARYGGGRLPEGMSRAAAGRAVGANPFAPVATQGLPGRLPGFRTGDKAHRTVHLNTPEGTRLDNLMRASTHMGSAPEPRKDRRGREFRDRTNQWGASPGAAPVWRRNQGGLIRDRAQDYRGGGMVKPRMNRYQSGGLVDAPVALEAMSMEEQVPAGLGAMMGPDVMAGPVADAAMAEPEVFPGMPNEMLTQIAGSMPPEQIGRVVEEVKLALQGRHPQGEHLLSVVEVMFPGMIEEVAMSMESTADGMTDSQLALLAPDEYVVDARTVSDLGNGSSDAGGRALDQMVQEVRMANTGTPEQPPGMDPEMFLPTGGMMP